MQNALPSFAQHYRRMAMAKAPPTWETFRDRSYYDMWAVRMVGERTFGQGVHVMTQAEAEGLRDLLNTTSQAEALRAEVERLSYDGIHTCHDGCPRLPCVQRREIERLRVALRACRRAVAGGKAEPRQTVREIVDLAIEEHDRKTEGKANA
jgi:hypothetical protein